MQYYEHFPIRGFQSMVDPQIHFGLGENALIDSMYIWWPDGKEQFFHNVQSDQILTISYKMASIRKKRQLIPQNKKLFIDHTD